MTQTDVSVLRGRELKRPQDSLTHAGVGCHAPGEGADLT